MSALSHRYRLVIAVVTFLCLSSICSNYIIINFTFICMRNDFSETISIGNQTRSAYDYSSVEKSYILWAVAIGTMIGTFPINYLYTKHGARTPFLIAGLVSALATGLVPTVAAMGLPWLVLIRFVQGLTYAADFAAIGLVCVEWAPLRETAIFICLLTAFTPFSSTVTNAVTGELCVSSLGWRSSFYFHSIAGVVLFSLWLILYSDQPQFDKRVSERELAVIQKGKTEQHKERSTHVPYMLLIRHPVVLCVWLNAFVEMTATILLSSYAPLYFHHVLGYDIPTTGILISLSTIAQIPFKASAAVYSDKGSYLSERWKMVMFNSLAVGVVGVLFAVVGHLPSGQPWMAVLCFTFIHCFSSMNCGGFYKCGTLVSRQYAHVVIGTIQWMKCVALFAAPAMVGIAVTEEDNQAQWTGVFSVLAVALLLVNFISYPIFTDEPADFTHEKRTETDEELSKMT